MEGAVDPKTGEAARPLHPEEQAFITNELVMTKASFRYWCNPPEAPIWMGDFSFKPLGGVKVGDAVIGWEKRSGPKAKNGWKQDHLCIATVQAVSRRTAPLIRIRLASGREVRCTPDHLWSNGKGSYRVGQWKPRKGQKRIYDYTWITAKVGRYLAFVVDPVNPPSTDRQRYVCGWLGGIYDGEGSHVFISQYAKANPGVHQRIQDYLTEAGILFTASPKGIRIVGGVNSYLRFLQLCAPVRSWYLTRQILGGRFRHPDRIVSIEAAGVGEVVSLQTTTGNYVAWGYASKNCERYAWCSAEGIGVKRMHPLFDSQELMLKELGRVELLRHEREEEEGILVNLLKARRLGASTFSIAGILHRETLQTNLDAMLAADVPDQSTYNFGIFRMMYEKLPWFLKPRVDSWAHTYPQRYEWDNGSRVWVGSGKALRGTEGERGDLGRGRGLPLVHLTELAKWEDTEQIASALMPTIAYSQRVLVFFESSPRGRGNFWHNHWLHALSGKSRFQPIFLPWYAEPRKYRRRPPDGWAPKDTTLRHAQRCEEQGHRWLHRAVRLTREQLYWYEFTREDYEAQGKLPDFLQEYAADPEECFVYSGRGLVPVMVQQQIADAARPLLGAFRIVPAAERRASMGNA